MTREQLSAAGGSPFPGTEFGVGMSLRDYFAAKALAGLLAAESDAAGGGAFSIANDKPKLTTAPGDFAVVAYQLADAMLSARLTIPVWGIAGFDEAKTAPPEPDDAA